MKVTRLTPADEAAIRRWPGYPGKLAAFDYALGEHGWLADHPAGPGNHRFAAWVDDDLVGFAILTETAPREAEFYIAIRADQISCGHGRALTARVLELGFDRLHFRRIHLKVRKWHEQAVQLYQSLGFEIIDEQTLAIDGRPDRFVMMEVRNSHAV